MAVEMAVVSNASLVIQKLLIKEETIVSFCVAQDKSMLAQLLHPSA